MENENNSNKDTTYQEKSKIFVIKDTPEEEEKFSIKEINSFQKEAMKENNGILKKTTTSESFPKKVEKYDKSKREINQEINPEKIGDMATVTTDKHRCQRPLRDIIGKRAQRREELEKMEEDLRQRLDMLECSIPAVTIWNIWNIMSQGAPICRVKRILEKQFKDTRELSCRSTPSCHYDYRVREVEAERKLALKKVEEARILCSEKLATLEERKRKLDEARKIQEEQKNAIEQLNEENRILQEAMKRKTIEMDESCECDDIQCKQRHLSKVSSVTSIESGDIQYLEKLQRFAEEEVITKREIAELERREEAYMRTLQQADELWSKMEGDMVSTTSALQEQLDMKTTANQQLANRVCELEDALEKCRGRLVACRTELEKFLSIETVEATIGRDDDVAKVADKKVAVKAKVVHRPIGRIDDIATVKDDEVLAKVEVADEGILAETKVVDEEALAIIEVEDKEALVITEVVDEEALAITEVEDKETLAITEVVDRLIGRIDDIATVKDDEVLAKVEVADEGILAETKVVDEEALTITEVEDKEALARVALPDADIEPPFIVDDKFVSVKPDLVYLAVDRPVDLVEIEDAESIVPPEDVAYEQQRFQEVREYLGQLSSLEELYTDDGVPCAPTFVCNDVVTSPTGMTDEELIALSVEHPVLTKERDKTVITEERERQFEKELVKKLDNAVDEVEKRKKKEDEIPGVDIERKIVEKVEKRITEDVDVRETVTLRASEEDDDRPVTMPKDRAPEVNKIKAANKQNQDIVIQRETILSWIDAIDTIRTTAAKHPECHEVEKDADILSEQVGSYIGIIPKKVEEENATINTKGKQEKVIEKNKIEIKQNKNEKLINETKLQDELIILKDKELKPVIKMDSEPFVDEKKKDIPTEIKIKEPTVYITEVEKFEPDKFPVADAEKAPITKAIEEKIKMEEPTPVLNGKEDSLLLDAAIKEEIKNEKPAIKKEEIETPEPLPIAEIEKNEVTELLSPIEIMEKKEKDEAVKLPPISDIVREEKIETVELPPIMDIVKEEQIEAEELLPRADVVIDEKIEIIQPIPTLPTIKKEMEEEIKDLEKMLEVEIKKEKDEEIEEVPLPEEVIPSIELFEKKEEEEIPQIKKEEIPTIAPLLQPTPKIEKEVPEEKRPEMIQINLTIPIADIKPTEMEVPAIPFDSRLVAQPYLIIAKIKEKEPLQIIPAKLPCTECCLQPPTETTKQFEIPQIDVPQIEVVQSEVHTEVIQSEVVQTKMMQTEIVQNEVEQAKIVQTEVIQSEVVQTKMMQTEIVQHEVEQAKVVQTESVKTEVVQITSQTISTSEPPRIRNTSEYLKPAELKASRTENAGDRPEITGRKMLWRKRLKDQSTVTTSSTGSQTDKTSHVSHDRVVRDERERARVPTDELLQSIKIAAGIARPDTEREIRTINYGGKFDETGKAACNCCTCGKTPTPPSTKSKLEVQPQIDATPPAAAMLKRMFIRPKIDQPILHDRLCSDCKVKIQSKMLQEKHHIKKIIKKISHDQESCSYVSLSSESCRAISQKRVIKKRDQGCLAKIPKQKINPIAQKRKDNLQSISEEKPTVEPLSKSCICFKLEKTGVEPIKKGNCYCGD